MIENLISEGIGVLVELLLVYFVITIILNKREKEKWLPVNQIIISRMLSVSHGIQSCLLFVSSPDSNKAQIASQIIGRVKYDYNKLQELVDLGGIGMGSNLLPDIMSQMESYEILIAKIEFLIKCHSVNHNKVYIAIKSPIVDLEAIDSTISEISIKFPTLIDDPRPESVSISNIKKSWELFKEAKNVSDNQQDFKSVSKSNVFAFNIDTMKMLHIEAGAKVEVFNTYL